MFKFDIDMKKIRVSILEMAEIMKNEWPFIKSKAINATAFQCYKELKKEMMSGLDRPTPYTMSNLWVTQGDKANPVATLWYKGWADKYLRPLVKGGGRPQKRSEQQLQRSGAMGAYRYYTPGRNAPLNSYGNINPGSLVKILSQTKSLWETKMNVSKKSKRRISAQSGYYFAIPRKKGNLMPGIYQKTSETTITRILMFVDNVVYRKILYFYEIVNKITKENLEKNIQDAIKWCKLNPYLKK